MQENQCSEKHLIEPNPRDRLEIALMLETKLRQAEATITDLESRLAEAEARVKELEFAINTAMLHSNPRMQMRCMKEVMGMEEESDGR